MTNEDKPYCVKLDDKMAASIEIWRHGEKEGGFQRKLQDRYLGKIIQTAKRGEAIPPIVVAKTDKSGYRLLDGQHRFEAWKIERFDLWVQINPLRPQKIIESFCTINGTARKLGLLDQLNVDTHAHAVRCRGIALHFNVKPTIVHALCVEVIGHRSRQPNIGKEQYQFVEDFLKFWTNDKRWEAKTGIYNKYGTLILAIKLSKKAKEPVEMLKRLQDMDYSETSPLRDRYGTDHQSISNMSNFVLRSFVRRGMVA